MTTQLPLTSASSTAPEHASAHDEIDVLDVLRRRVLADEEIVVTGCLNPQVLQAHARVIASLVRDTGRAVAVRYLP